MIEPNNSNIIVAHLLKIVFDESASAYNLLQIAIVFAIIWFLIFKLFKIVLRPIVHNQPWLINAIERDYESAGKKMMEDLQISFTKEEYIKWAMNDWPKFQGIYFQHAVGACFCLPSLLGWGDPSTASSLAICGVLCEMGWEMQDMVEMLIIRFFFKNGKLISPDGLIILFAVHHSLTSVLGVPMIMNYRTSKALHWLCFDLQFAAAIALAVGEYTKVLDTSNPGQLRQFKFLNGFALVTMVWTRIIHWVYLCIELFIVWYNDQAWGFLIVGGFLSLIFSFFSFICCVKPFYKKFMKFLHVSAEYEALPADATPERRRQSVLRLEVAAADLIAEDEMMEAAELLAPIFVRRKVERRQSAPIQSVSRKRRSLMMLKAKDLKSDFHVVREAFNEKED